MIDVSAVIRDAIDGYRSSGVKLTVPFQNYTPSPSNHIRPSSLGLCPLKAAYDKHRIPEDYPIDNDWIMNHGSYVEPMIQEPLMHYAMTKSLVSYEPQVDFTGDIGGISVSGRADGVLRQVRVVPEEDLVRGESCLIEIKDTEGQRHRSLPEPKLRYVWQMLCGMLILGISQGALVLCSKWGYQVYDLLPVGDGWQVYSYGKKCELLYGDNWNTPERLSKRGLINELEYFGDFNSTIQNGEPFDVPMEVTHWLCTSEIRKPTKTKTGLAKPNCPYCLRCHGLENKLYETKLVDKRTEINVG